MSGGFDRLSRVLPQTARVNGAGRLEIGGCDLQDVADEFGTPTFVMDEATFTDRLTRYRDTFGADNVHYASKAFLLTGIARMLAGLGVGIDCASGGELYTALAAGFPPDRIVLHGNNKSRSELEQAVDCGIGAVVVDSPLELEMLEAVASERGTHVNILIRVTPGIEAHTHEYLKTGIEDTKFGVPIGEEALEAIGAAASSRRVRLVGLHAHIGSQILDLSPFAELGETMTSFLAQAREQTGLDLPILDLGGGLGIAYEPDDDPPAIEDLGKVLIEAVSTTAERIGTPVPSVRVEPGRSAIGPAVVTMYEAGVVKEVRGHRTYVSVDGGMSDNIRPMLYQARYTFCSATRAGQAHDTPVAISGKLCETGDVLIRDALLPAVAPGDLIVTAATGAYCYAMASNYNRQPRPAVVAVGNGSARLLSRRETFDDLIRLEV